MVNSPYYDNPYWEFHLPINQPIAPGKDLDMDGEIYEYTGYHAVELNNWLDEDGSATYRPRFPIGLDKTAVNPPRKGFVAVDDDEENFDCD